MHRADERPANSANCNVVVTDLTPKGSYTRSPSPYGTFDQGGNVSEWTESGDASSRGLRGGNFFHLASSLAASSGGALPPSAEDVFYGFRLPEPDARLQLCAAVAALLLLNRRRHRA